LIFIWHPAGECYLVYVIRLRGCICLLFLAFSSVDDHGFRYNWICETYNQIWRFEFWLAER